jgi:hypothetical protein
MIDVDLRTYLISNSDITGLVGNDVYALRLPQDKTTTAIVYDIGAGFPLAQIGSLESVVRYNVTLTAYSPSYVTMRQLSEHITTQLNGMSGSMGTTNVTGAHVESVINTYEEEQKLYRNIIILNIYTN